MDKSAQNPFVREIIRLAGTLLVITLIVAGCLGAVDAITADKIESLALEKIQRAMNEVIPGGSFEQVEFSDDSGLIQAVYTATVSGEYAGMCFEVSPNGFGGAIGLIVGVSPENTVLGVQVVSSTETSGLGSRASEPEWREQFVGKTGPLTVQKNEIGRAHV